MISIKIPAGPLATNAILIGCSQTLKAAVIDPAQGSAEIALKKAKEAKLSIEKILLTHTHFDHIADVASLRDLTGAKVYVHPLDAPNLEHPGIDGLPLFFPVRAAKPDYLIEDGGKISIGSLECIVLHTPGHSPGGVCYYFPVQKVLFSGDTLFAGTIGNLSLPTASAPRMWESLRKIARLPPDTRIVPGHGKDTVLSKETWIARAEELYAE